MRRRFLLAASLLLPAGAADAATTPVLGFDELYGSWAVTGLTFSARLQSLVGSRATMRGFMAPPLKAEADFFVLAKEPMALCPFCSSDSEWPVDIVVVYLRRQAMPVDPATPIETTGLVEIGSWTDPATGFVSQVRLRDASFRAV